MAYQALAPLIHHEVRVPIQAVDLAFVQVQARPQDREQVDQVTEGGQCPVRHDVVLVVQRTVPDEQRAVRNCPMTHKQNPYHSAIATSTTAALGRAVNMDLSAVWFSRIFSLASSSAASSSASASAAASGST